MVNQQFADTQDGDHALVSPSWMTQLDQPLESGPAVRCLRDSLPPKTPWISESSHRISSSWMEEPLRQPMSICWWWWQTGTQTPRLKETSSLQEFCMITFGKQILGAGIYIFNFVFKNFALKLKTIKLNFVLEIYSKHFGPRSFTSQIQLHHIVIILIWNVVTVLY